MDLQSKEKPAPCKGELWPRGNALTLRTLRKPETWRALVLWRGDAEEVWAYKLEWLSLNMEWCLIPTSPALSKLGWSLSNRHGRTQDSPPFLRQLMEFVQRMRQERDEDMGPGVDCCLPVSVSTIHTCMCLNSSSSLSIPTIPLHLRLDTMKTCDFHLSWRSQTPISYSSTSHIFDTLFIPNYQK